MKRKESSTRDREKNKRAHILASDDKSSQLLHSQLARVRADGLELDPSGLHPELSKCRPCVKKPSCTQMCGAVVFNHRGRGQRVTSHDSRGCLRIEQEALLLPPWKYYGGSATAHGALTANCTLRYVPHRCPDRQCQ
jgi:hypothetical protein